MAGGLPLARRAAFVAALPLLTACGSGDAPTGPTGPATVTRTVTSPAAATASTSTAGTSAPPSPTTCSTPVALRSTPVEGTAAGSRFSWGRVTLSATCDGVRGTQELADRLNSDAAAELAEWRKGSEGAADGQQGSFTRTTELVVNTQGLVVARSSTDWYFPGAAHPSALSSVTILATDTGALVSQADLVSELARHGLSRARLTAIVAKSADAAADKRAPGAADAPAPLSLDDVDLWPGRSGLHGSVDQGAHYATALGVVEFTVPWDELVPKGADLSFLPDRWGH